MSKTIQSVRDLIALWPARQEVVDDLSRRGFDVTLSRVHKWVQFGSIPARYHSSIISAAQARGFAVTGDDMSRIHHAPDRGDNQGSTHVKPPEGCADDAA